MTTTWTDTPTKHIDVDGVRFAYRELGPTGGTPVVLLHHFTATLDDWDPRIIDGVASLHHVIAFDNRGIGGTGSKAPPRSTRWPPTQSRSSGRLVSPRSICSASPSAEASRRWSPCRRPR